MKKTRLDAIILGGGRGERLYPLTRDRAKPAVPIGGKYRLIDIPISNCIHSGIQYIFILTQFNTHSLHRHISDTYKFDTFRGGLIEILAAQQTPLHRDWFQGTADAVRSYRERFAELNATDFIILAGDHLYKMDFRPFFAFHRRKKADVTVAVKPMPTAQASQFGVLHYTADRLIDRFVEKPKDPALVESLVLPDTNDAQVAASMGIYIFRKEVLFEALEFQGNDFGHDIIPQCIKHFRTYAYPFNGYWADIGTIDTFFQANMALTSRRPPFSFYEPYHPIYTHARFLPSTHIHGAVVDHCLISEGCRIGKAKLHRSIVGIRGIVADNVEMDHVYYMGNDFYEDRPPRGELPLGIGKGCHLKNAILDKDVRIGAGCELVNRRGVLEEDGEFYSIRQGITIIPKGTRIPPGTVL